MNMDGASQGTLNERQDALATEDISEVSPSLLNRHLQNANKLILPSSPTFPKKESKMKREESSSQFIQHIAVNFDFNNRIPPQTRIIHRHPDQSKKRLRNVMAKMEETKVVDEAKGAATNISDAGDDLEIALGLNLECELDNEVVLKVPKVSPENPNLQKNEMIASMKISREDRFRDEDHRDLFNNSRNLEQVIIVSLTTYSRGQNSPKKGATTHDLREPNYFPRQQYISKSKILDPNNRYSALEKTKNYIKDEIRIDDAQGGSALNTEADIIEHTRSNQNQLFMPLVANKAGIINYLCANQQQRHMAHNNLQGDTLSQYYCPEHQVYVCEDCFDEHRDHVDPKMLAMSETRAWPAVSKMAMESSGNPFLANLAKADSIKNHLGNLFNEWLHLQSHALNVSKSRILQNLKKHENFFKFLKNHSQVKPDIEATTLVIIFEKYIKRLRETISDIKHMCQKNDLSGALRLRLTQLQQFKTQLYELEQRSTASKMISSYLIPVNGSRIIRGDFQHIQYDPVLLNLELLEAPTLERDIKALRINDLVMTSSRLSHQLYSSYDHFMPNQSANPGSRLTILSPRNSKVLPPIPQSIAARGAKQQEPPQGPHGLTIDDKGMVLRLQYDSRKYQLAEILYKQSQKLQSLQHEVSRLESLEISCNEMISTNNRQDTWDVDEPRAIHGMLCQFMMDFDQVFNSKYNLIKRRHVRAAGGAGLPTKSLQLDKLMESESFFNYVDFNIDQAGGNGISSNNLPKRGADRTESQIFSDQNRQMNTLGSASAQNYQFNIRDLIEKGQEEDNQRTESEANDWTSIINTPVQQVSKFMSPVPDVRTQTNPFRSSYHRKDSLGESITDLIKTKKKNYHQLEPKQLQDLEFELEAELDMEIYSSQVSLKKPTSVPMTIRPTGDIQTEDALAPRIIGKGEIRIESESTLK